MEVRIWGCRGSLPASVNAETVLRKVVRAVRAAVTAGVEPEMAEAFVGAMPFAQQGTYGTNTSCVEIRGGDCFVLCDCGTGLRDFGRAVLAEHGPAGHEFHIFLSHPHWDHIQGFPFFVPTYVPGNRIVVHGCHPDLAEVFAAQQREPSFPVDFSVLGADIEFVRQEPGQAVSVAGLSVTPFIQRHPGGSYGYRFEKDGKAVVYSTDCEHEEKIEPEDSPFLPHFKDADLLIFDAQYTYLDALTSKKDWGHSNNILGVELAMAASVRHLCLFHSEPTLRDEELDRFLESTIRYAELMKSGIKVSMAFDGLTVAV